MNPARVRSVRSPTPAENTVRHRPPMRTPRSLPLVLGALVVLTLAPLPAAGQPMRPDTESGASGGSRVSGNLGGRLGVARLDEDWYLAITPTLHLQIDDVAITRDSPLFDSPQVHPLQLHFEAPLFVRVRDNTPTDDRGRFRREQWDEPSEYGRIVRWIQYATPYDGIYFRGGELSDVRIGHRTIVDAYDNALDSDHFQWGVHHNLNTIYGGLETFVDDVTNPDVMALRLYARPWAFVDPSSPLRRLAVGATLAGDQAAPLQLEERADGTGFVADDNGNLQVTSAMGTALLGFDIEYQLIASDRVSITPYTDTNTHFARGTGWHVGSFFGFKLTDTIVLDMRAEYRLMGRSYLPGYIGRVYEIERLTYLPVSGFELDAPKLRWTGATDLGRRNGYYAELGFNFADLVYVSGGWEDQTGANNNAAWAQLRIPALSIVQFGAYFVNTRFEGAAGLVDLENALAVAEVRVSPLPWLFVDGQLRRRWEVSERGAYEPVNDWSIGAGVSFGF